MSPSEDDLRAALRAGEHDPSGRPDADHVVALGRRTRSRRRGRLAAVAGSVALVVVAAGVTTVLVGRDDGGTTLADPTGPGVSAPPGSSVSRAAGQRSPATPSSALSSGPSSHRPADPAPPGCPATFPQRALPGGGSPGQFGADGSVLPTSVTVVSVCNYGTATIAAAGAPAAQLVLRGSAVTALRQALDSGDTQARVPGCPAALASSIRQVAFVGVTATGAPARVVTTTLTGSCGQRATNGTAFRFSWQLPAGLSGRIYALKQLPLPPRSFPRPAPTGRNIGSPVR
ncbi:hypothetical protein SAMN05443575_3811 [Jatrophihabitans endophyticus]|uniref:Uncharacterized protein n=1 Tax=Jatrophihabitans endophyticus TaxID=1206085 RepID=A0A1M5STY9_9ACTN|nr:hypothetical protein [Jatrophihabitans endophyticus]SHH41708.1 hypothetical protein SAMN05443575_3811 [Jatrophihabitans endophyticus]